MSWPSPELEPLLAVVAATVDEHGALVWANAGFHRLIGPEATAATRAQVPQCFIQPDFATLASAPAGAEGDVYRGLLTLGDYAGHTQSVRGRVWRDGARLHLLAEYDIADLERLNATVLALNADYASAQLALAQANLGMQRLNALLERQKADLQATLDRVKRLEGMLSICMYCKRIRAEHDDWQQLEHYVADHSDAVFSHGLCPACFAAETKKLGKPHLGIVP